MPNGDNGENPGVDDDANKSGTNNGDAAGNAGDKSDKGKGKGGKDDKDDDDDKSGQIVFKSQKDLDAVIEKRLERERKKAADDAKLTNEQRLEKERDEALKLVSDRDRRDDFIAEIGLPYAKAVKLYGIFRDDIETNDKGKATNMADVVKKAKSDWPELFTDSGDKRRHRGKGDGGSGKGEGEGTGDDMNAALRQMAGRGPRE